MTSLPHLLATFAMFQFHTEKIEVRSQYSTMENGTVEYVFIEISELFWKKSLKCKELKFNQNAQKLNLGKLVESNWSKILQRKTRRKHIQSTHTNVGLIFVILLYYQPNYHTINYKSEIFRAIIQPKKLYYAKK